jgi:hypothetical protein
MENQQPNTEETPTPSEDRAGEDTAGLDRIRDILFGTAQRELERRVVRSDTQSTARLLELEQESRRRLEILEAHVKRETESLLARLQAEIGTVTEAMRKQAREQRDALSDLETKLGRFEEASARGQRDMRHELLDQAKGFLDELQRVRKDVLASLQDQLGLDEGEGGAEGQRRHH